jgi:hypothetical protein
MICYAPISKSVTCYMSDAEINTVLGMSTLLRQGHFDNIRSLEYGRVQ